MEIFVEGLYDAVLDCLKVVPVLFLAYLLIEILSHDHGHKMNRFLSKQKKTSVLYASLLGCVPQCGFSSVVADLYSRKSVSLGTLVAVFVATSDEAIPLMISHTDKILDLLLLVGVKLALAIFWGYMIDLAMLAFRKKQKPVAVRYARGQSQKHKHSHSTESVSQSSCGHVHTNKCACDHNHSDCCASNIFLDAFAHAFSILIYIFVATFAINLIIGYCGTSALEGLFTTNPYVQIAVASLIGLIPNCASSVLLVQLNMVGTLCFPALVAGLSAGTGVGLFILWSKNRKKPLQNLGIMAMQYAIGVLSGIFLTIFF